MRHKHADVIHAWAEGAEVQYRWGENWSDVKTPSFSLDFDFRIKPKTVVEYQWLFRDKSVNYWEGITSLRTEDEQQNYQKYHDGLIYEKLESSRKECEC